MYKLPVKEYQQAIEACRLRAYMEDKKGFCDCICSIFGAVPLKADKDNFYDFLNTIYNAGRIAGIRSERRKNTQR